LTTNARVTTRLPQAYGKQNGKNGQYRQFSKTAARRIESQEAPNSQAYLNSGAIAGARDLVDVKKVLVIGSGGLSIGQAGEFDYSGQFEFFRLSARLQFFFL
jgi:carbamoyl-phosphate synthase large subunit